MCASVPPRHTTSLAAAKGCRLRRWNASTPDDGLQAAATIHPKKFSLHRPNEDPVNNRRWIGDAPDCATHRQPANAAFAVAEGGEDAHLEAVARIIESVQTNFGIELSIASMPEDDDAGA